MEAVAGEVGEGGGMSAIELLSFDQALAHSEKVSTRHLLLGNGFSIACRPNIFVYGKLFERADFGQIRL